MDENYVFKLHLRKNCDFIRPHCHSKHLRIYFKHLETVTNQRGKQLHKKFTQQFPPVINACKNHKLSKIML